MSKYFCLVVSQEQVRFALMPGVGLVGDALAIAATQAPTFIRTNHLLPGNDHVAADFNGDGKPDAALDHQIAGFIASCIEPGQRLAHRDRNGSDGDLTNDV